MAYLRGVEAGRLWSKTQATSEELARLHDEYQLQICGYASKIYYSDLYTACRIADIIQDPEFCDDNAQYDPDSVKRYIMEFWGSIIGSRTNQTATGSKKGDSSKVSWLGL